MRGQTPTYLNHNILQIIMHNTYSQPSSPLIFTYRTRDEEQTRSVQSSTYSHLTVQRINQIRPTSKIVIPKNAKVVKKPQITSNKPKLSHTQTSTIQTSPTRTHHKLGGQKKDLKKEKAMFNWHKFTFICGAEQIILGQNGCLCSEPCKWKKQWTKNHQKNDFATFRSLLDQTPKQEYLQQIQKDLLRTYPQCPTFAVNSEYIRMLRYVLVAYSIYDSGLGYVQGVNMIAGVLLYHIKNPQQTFWALVQMMEYQELRMLYLDQFRHLKIHIDHIMTIIKQKLPDLHDLIEELDIIPECFLNGWLFSLMSNCIPIEYMPAVIDRFRLRGWNFIYQLIVSYLLFLKERLLVSEDQAQFLQYLSTQAGRQIGGEWSELIKRSEKVIL